tara:strand:- start:133 stop:1368 length:1236 start_codon:yes stop_codon:yes gene_type:complete
MSKRKSTIFTNSRGYSYYQTFSYQDTYGRKKKRITKYLGQLNEKEKKARKKELDKHYDYIDTNTIKGNPTIKEPNTLKNVLKQYEKYNFKRVDNLELSRITAVNHTNYTEQFRKFLDRRYKGILVPKITTEMIKAYQTYRKKKGLKQNTIKNDMTYLKTFFKWLVRENYIIQNPFNHEIKIPKYQSRTIDEIPMGEDWDKLYSFIEKSLDFNPTTDDERKKWTWFNRNTDFKEMLYFMLNTAMRGGEIQILKWTNDKDEVGETRFPYSHLNRDMKTMTIYFKRTLTTNFELPETLQKLIQKRFDSRNPKDKYVFTNPGTNNKYSKEWLISNFKRLCEGLGLVDKRTQEPLFTPHSIRHGVISQLLKQGIPIQDISRVVARHSKIGTTYDIYGHIQVGKGKSILDSLNKREL